MSVDVDAATLAAVRRQDIQAFMERPAKWQTMLPIVILVPLGGPSVGSVFEKSDYLAECYAGSRKAARDLANDVRAAVLDAWLDTSGPLNWAAADGIPVPFPSGVDGAWRFNVTVTCSAR